jgi:hypothetical protein
MVDINLQKKYISELLQQRHMEVTIFPRLQISWYIGYKISVSLSYIIVRGESKMEGTKSRKMPYALSIPFPPPYLS